MSVTRAWHDCINVCICVWLCVYLLSCSSPDLRPAARGSKPSLAERWLRSTGNSCCLLGCAVTVLIADVNYFPSST